MLLFHERRRSFSRRLCSKCSSTYICSSSTEIELEGTVSLDAEKESNHCQRKHALPPFSCGLCIYDQAFHSVEESDEC